MDQDSLVLEFSPVLTQPPEGGREPVRDPIELLPMTQLSYAPLEHVGRSEELHYIWGTNISEEEFRHGFRVYLETFVAPGGAGQEEASSNRRLYYVERMLQMYMDGTTSLELDMTWLEQTAPETFLNTVHHPTECCQIMSAVVEEMFRELISSRHGLPVPEDVLLTVAPRRLPTVVPLKALSPHHIEQLISVKGMVIRSSKVIPEVRVACFECWNCRYVERSACGDRGRIFEPTRCAHCGKSYTFKLQHNLSIFEDKQLIKIQESPENVSDGETPMSISIVVYGSMVDEAIPGDRVIVTGIYRCVPIRLNANTRIMKSIFATHMDALHIELVRSSRVIDNSRSGPPRPAAAASSAAGTDEGPSRTISKERLDLFYQIAHRSDIYDILLHSFARTIWGHDDVKRGILSQLFGGTPKKFVFTRSAQTTDPAASEPARDPFLGSTASRPSAFGSHVTGGNAASFRSELNVLLCGDPGVAKSQLLTQVHEVAPRGVYTSGKGSSSVGLTAYVVKDSDTGELVLEPGALVLSDQGLCCIDEFDKMNESTRSVLLEVMEQQTLSIAKAGIIAQLNARTSILAAANPKESQWNPSLNIVENLQVESTLLSRFDLIYLLLDRHDPAEDRRLASHVLSLYTDQAAAPSTSSLPSDVLLELGGEAFLRGGEGDAHMPTSILSEYIAVAREHAFPKLTKESHKQLASSYVELRRARGSTRTVSATLRQLESMIRLAEARAKMRLGDTVTIEDVHEAKRLMSAALKEAATDPKTGLIRLDMFHAPDPSKNTVEGNLQRLEALIRQQYVSAGKYTLTVLELRHSFNESLGPSTRPLSAGPFLELLALAAGGDVIQSFTATMVTLVAQ